MASRAVPSGSSWARRSRSIRDHGGAASRLLTEATETRLFLRVLRVGPVSVVSHPRHRSMSAVVYLFLAHLGAGIAITLLLVSKEAGVKFFRFNAGVAALLIAAALAFRPRPGAAGAQVVTAGSFAALAI